MIQLVLSQVKGVCHEVFMCCFTESQKNEFKANNLYPQYPLLKSA